MRYLSQRYTMPYKEVTGTLTDIGTEELAHMEMVCAIVYQLTKDLSPEEIERSGFAPYYVNHINRSLATGSKRRPMGIANLFPIKKADPHHRIFMKILRQSRKRVQRTINSSSRKRS